MMTSYPNQGYFCRAKWHLFFLTPFWILQFTMLLSLSAIFIYRLTETIQLSVAKGRSREDLLLQHVWEATNVALPLISAGLTGAEVIRFFEKNITPSWMVLSHILKTFFASVVLALDVTVYVKRITDPYVTPGLAIGCALVLITCVPATYVTVVYRRLLKHEYHHPGCEGLKKTNLSGRKSGDKAPSLSLTTPVSESISMGKCDKMGGYLTSETLDARWPDAINKEATYLASAPPPPAPEPHRSHRLSFGSFKSLRRSKTQSKTQTTSAAYEFVERDSMDPSRGAPRENQPMEKYTHERCTAFDEYVQRRLSSDDSMERVECSWVGGPPGTYRPRPSNLDFFSQRRRSSSGYSSTTSLPSPIGLPRAPLPMATALLGSSRITSRNSQVGILGSVPENAEENVETNNQQPRHASLGRLRASDPVSSWAIEPMRRVTIAGTGPRYSKYEPMQSEWPFRADSDVWVPASAFDFETQPLHKNRQMS